MSTYDPEARSIKYQEVKATNFKLHRELEDDKDYNTYLHGLKTIINIPLLEFKGAFPYLKVLKKAVCLPDFKDICIKFANKYDMLIIKYLHQIHLLYNKNKNIYDKKIAEYEKYLEEKERPRKILSLKIIDSESDDDEIHCFEQSDYESKSKSELIKILNERDHEIKKLKEYVEKLEYDML